MKNKKMLIGVIDVVLILTAIMMIIFNTKATTIIAKLQESIRLANNEELSFNLIASPEEARVKAGDTVTIKLSVADINIGENGLNSIVGNLQYDESLFEKMEISGIQNKSNNSELADWNIELNKIKEHTLYGKFCIHTMQEGVIKNQDTVEMTLKLKSDLKPQTTEVRFLNIKSSDGNVGIDEQNRIVKIIIYEDEIPEEPETPEVQTGDTIVGIAILIIAIVIAANIVIFGKKGKSKLIVAAVIVIMGLLGLGITVFATDTTIEQQIQALNKSEAWLNSQKYLVTDTDITRIPMQTSIETIKDKFNKEIKVFSDNQEVTQGIIKTGMKIQAGEEICEVGVFGDLDKDGDSNQVELTNIIRNVVNKEKWELSDFNKKNVDMKLDGKIDEKDVQSSIKYIVYGEYAIPEFEQVLAPSIEVIDGTYINQKSSYIDEITLQITENEQDAQKTMYKIEGISNGVPYTQIQNQGTVRITEDGVYKISAYTYGKLGNRSEITSKIVVKQPGLANCTIHHYIEGTTTKVAEDEIINSIEGNTFSVTHIGINTNKILINGVEDSTQRIYLSANEYQFVNGTSESENITIDSNGTATGTFASDMQEITYYYHINTFTITGMVAIENGDVYTPVTEDAKGTIEGGDGLIPGILETVRYGRDSSYDISANREIIGYGVKLIKVYSGTEIDGNYEISGGTIIDDYIVESDGKVNILPKFINMTENKHIVVVFEELPIVARIVNVPQEYTDSLENPDDTINGKEYHYLTAALLDIKGAADIIPNVSKENRAENFEIQILANIGKENCTVWNKNSCTIDLNGFKISSNKDIPTLIIDDGILKVVDRTVDIKGAIENLTEKTGIRDVISVYITTDGTLIFGDLDASDPSDLPTIQGTTYGIYKEEYENEEGRLEFYDGQVIGEIAIYGEVDETPYLWNASTTVEDNKQVARLEVVSDVEAAIGDSTYTKLENAFDAANLMLGLNNNPVEIDLLSDVGLEEITQINNNRDITLDLNGYNINLTGNAKFLNNGKFTIKDSTTEANEEITFDTNRLKGIITANAKEIVENTPNSEFVLNSGTLKSVVSSGNITNPPITYTVINNGTMNMNGGSIFAQYTTEVGRNNARGILNETSLDSASIATLTINGGQIDLKEEGVTNTSKLIIRGMVQSSDTHTRSRINNTGNTEITGGVIGTVTNNTTSEDVELQISNAEINTVQNTAGKVAITNLIGGCVRNSGTMTIEDGDYGSIINNSIIDINTVTCASITNSSGVATIEESIVIANIENEGKLNINNSTINGKLNINDPKVLGRIVETNVENTDINDDCTIEKGTLSILGTSVVKNILSSVQSDEIVVNIGSKDGIVNAENPEISGINVNNDCICYYDGIISGTTMSVKKYLFKEVEQGYTIVETVDESNKTVELVEQTENVASIAKTYSVIGTTYEEEDENYYYYNSLKTAIEACGTEENPIVIKVLQNNLLVPDRITIAENQKIQIDLNNNKVNLYSKIVNNGELEILDSSTTKLGELNSNYTLFENNKTLKLQQAKYVSVGNAITNSAEGTVVLNNANITGDIVNDVINAEETISANNSSITGNIVNNSVINFTNTNIIGDITNNLSAEINITGGEISNGTIGTKIINNGIMDINSTDLELVQKITNNGPLTLDSIQMYCENRKVIENSDELVIDNANITWKSTNNQYNMLEQNNQDANTIIKGNSIISINEESTNSNSVLYIQEGKLIIGEQGGTPNATYPKIEGNNYGVLITVDAEFEFYDGSITGLENKSISGEAECETGYEIIKTVVAGKETAKLGRNTMVKMNGTEYYNIQEAVDAIEGNTQQTIELLRNVTLNSETQTTTIASGINILLDLKGYTIQGNNAKIFQNAGTLEVISTARTEDISLGITAVTAGTGKIINSVEIFDNTGTLTLGNANFENAASGTEETYISIVKNSGTLNINTGSNINSEGTYKRIVENSGITNLNSGAIKSTNTANTYGIYNTISTATVNITGGNIGQKNGNTITGPTFGIYNGNVLMTSGAIYVSEYGVYSDDSESTAIELNGGNINTRTGKASVYNNNTRVININNITITDYILNASTGTINIGNNTIVDGWLYNSNAGIININGTGVDITQGTTTSGYYGNGTSCAIGNVSPEGIVGTINIISCEIENGKVYNENGIINIGKKDDTIVIDNPILNNCILYNGNGTINYYDGTIITDTPILGQINEIEENSQIVITEATEKNTYTLQKNTNVASIETVEYKTISSAVTNAITGSTIKLLSSIALSDDNNISIPTDKSIILDLNGNKLYVNSTILNNGTLEIIDSSLDSTGEIIIGTETVFKNNNNLTFTSGKINGEITSKMMGNYYSSIIDNSGSFVMNGGTINLAIPKNKTSVGIAFIKGTGNIELAGGTITAESLVPMSSIRIVEIDSEAETAEILLSGVNIQGITNVVMEIYNANAEIRTGTSIDGVAIYIGGTLKVMDGEILNCTIRNYGTFKFIGGEATGITILNNSELDIGNGNYPVITTNPDIKGKVVNNNNNTFNFYDGVINDADMTNPGTPITGGVTETQRLYTLKYSADNTEVTLEIDATFEDVASTNNVMYDTLEGALEAVTPGAIIKLEKDIVLQSTLIIPEEKSLTLDLNGKFIMVSGGGPVITNNGTLTIIDSKNGDNSAIRNFATVAIENNGTLNIGENDVNVNTITPRIIGWTYAIDNNGTLNLYDGILKGVNDTVDGVINGFANGYQAQNSTELIDGTTLKTTTLTEQ